MTSWNGVHGEEVEQMTRELLILRHGKSDWSAGTDDFHRPLLDRGKRAAQRIGVWLARQGLLPDYVVSSPAERAIVTAEKCYKAMGCSARQIHRDKNVYEAGPQQLLQVLAACPDEAQRVLLVGHNPGLEQLLEYLVAGELPATADGKLLPTATLARLTMPADWRQLESGCAELVSLTRPASLPEKFPFPDPGSSELRDRPAYYYSQSSVIPWRLRDGQPEILVIASSKKKHRVVPKGIREPGLTSQESAAREAREEAGIEGRVGSEPLGTYQYAKWGATCTVEVFPMEVTREIPEAEWKERHRDRVWLTPANASKCLKQRALRPMIDTLVARLGEHGG
jgi:phosphohistidine phosphatase